MLVIVIVIVIIAAIEEEEEEGRKEGRRGRMIKTKSGKYLAHYSTNENANKRKTDYPFGAPVLGDLIQVDTPLRGINTAFLSNGDPDAKGQGDGGSVVRAWTGRGGLAERVIEDGGVSF